MLLDGWVLWEAQWHEQQLHCRFCFSVSGFMSSLVQADAGNDKSVGMWSCLSNLPHPLFTCLGTMQCGEGGPLGALVCFLRYPTLSTRAFTGGPKEEGHTVYLWAKVCMEGPCNQPELTSGQPQTTWTQSQDEYGHSKHCCLQVTDVLVLELEASAALCACRWHATASFD